MSRLKPVSSKTLKADMQKVARNVGVLIEETGNFFGVMWDGWSHSSVHYVDIYGVFIVKGKRIVHMLAISPFEVVSDNCSSKQRIATLLELPLVGCASYRYNLVANRYMVAYETEFAGLNQLMVQLRHCNNAAELAKLTDLAPPKRNMTRWSSTFEMVLRHKRIRDDVRQVEAVEEHVSTGAAHKKLMGRLEHLKKLDSVCKTLQDEGTSMADVHLLFDQVTDDYPVTASYLHPNAKIVHTPVFEAALGKIDNDRKLTAAEARAVERFAVEPSTSTGKRKERSSDNYASEILRGGKQPVR
ncbi:hypothetical protein JG687_00015466 [Phytophthora cactorum]|uniref:Uncharacterized protein n=1 Tax=Phytophthora cactorum TaxID=29920 RepID=A0A8T1TWU3_9STRA|nr:hypothetical protein JG687_00015466 [Phytophthora cactorum]